MAGSEVVGGLTAHLIPMTKSQTSELFIYDIAVAKGHQRKGVGRRLVNELFTMALERGVLEPFVLASNEDIHALDFYRSLGGHPSNVTLFTFSLSQDSIASASALSEIAA